MNTSSTRENGESVLFQPVLKAYPTHHSWLITAHISLETLEQHWKSFIRQMDWTHQIVVFKSLTLCTDSATFSITGRTYNLNDIYTSYKPITLPVINLLATDPSFDGNSNYNKHVRRSLLPFLGNALVGLQELPLLRILTVSRKEWINSLQHNPHNNKL